MVAPAWETLQPRHECPTLAAMFHPPQASRHSSWPRLVRHLLGLSTSSCRPACSLQAGVVAFKLYPAGATTNSDSGVTDWRKCLPTLKAMAEVGRRHG